MDLKDQGMGDAHIFFRSEIVRAKMFYANPQPVKKLKVNQFLKVEPPPDSAISKLQKQLVKFQSILSSEHLGISNVEDNETIAMISKILQNSSIEDPIERNINLLMVFGKEDTPDIPVETLIDDTVAGEITIFTPLVTKADSPKLWTSSTADFCLPLLDPSLTRNQIMAIERLMGENSGQALNISNELIKDFKTSTQYPPKDQAVSVDKDDLVVVIKSLCDKFNRARDALPSQ